MPRLIILAGIPGSGKSTIYQALFGGRAIRVSSDAIRDDLFGHRSVAHNEETKEQNNARVFELFHVEIRRFLNQGFDVVADATALHEFARQELVDDARACDADVHLFLFTNIQQAVERNAARGPDTRVPEEAMTKFIRRYYDTLFQLRTGAEDGYDSVTYIGGVG